PAVALAGCSLADADARDLGPARRLLIALDHDATGQAQTRDLILRLGPQARVVTWPAKDANAWAQAGAGASEAANLLTSAPDAVQWLLDAIPPDVPSTDLSQHLEPLLDLLTQLDPMTAQAHLRAIKGRFQLTMDVFRGLEKNLAAARRSQTAPPTALAGEVLTSPYYEDRAGELWYIDPSRPWPQNEHRVAAFSARIVAERLVDDGAECVTWFDLAGELRHGRGFEISIPAATFADPQRLETALLDAVGSAAVIEPRRGAYFKRAVQYLSPAPARREVFSHTGWRTFGERRVFLTAGGALGYPDSDICVDLDGSLNRYTLPLEPQDPGAALRASLRTLDLAADQVTFPLWAGMFLAPLGEWLRLDFTLWPYGPTGCLKSTLSALFLAHYGAFSRTMLPGNWASTANALERLAFLAKDVPLIIDDFAPQNQGRDATEIERKAERLIRGAGNRQGRQRLRSDLRARPEYYPRGLLISNGEQLPSGQSIMARVLGLEMDANGIDLAQLGAAQAEADCYPHALAGYILWLADQWADLTTHLPAAWRDARSQVHAYHLRVPEVYASLYVALDLALQYAEHAGAVTPALGRELLARGDAALREACYRQKYLAEQERPVVRFLQVITELLATEAVRLDPRYGEITADTRAELLGWQDTEHWYLLSGQSYNTVARYCRAEGGHFPLKAGALHKMLFEENAIQNRNGRFTELIRQGDEVHRVLKIGRREVARILALGDA
ncbi:MAG: DUF927 domain-containing protein, partial [Chloroflexi bacterium]|nr:DUF927 domain-containing protein [Chloroflexota bacterium]